MKPTVNWRLCSIFALLAALLLIPVRAQAGGWVTVTMEQLPRVVHAEEEIELRFVVRQHGMHPIHVDQAALVAIKRDDGEVLRVEATPVEPKGYHQALVTFPQAGVWDWSFEPLPFPSKVTFAPLTVLAAEESQPATNWLVGWLRSLVRRTPTASASADDNAEYGRALFLAKGCASCHHHDEAGYEWNVSVGPDLTRYNPDPLFVRSWLRNADVLTANRQWGMPTLELSDEEIEALIVFLQQSSE